MVTSTKTSLNVLNDDILHMIVACMLEDALDTWPSNDHLACAVRMSHIFRRLRTIITSRPIFWNRLFVSLEVPGMAFDTVLARSDQVQLHVFVMDPVCLRLIRPTAMSLARQDQWRKSAIAFLEHRSRICELEIHGQSGERGELGLADVLGPPDTAQQIATQSHSLRRLALHDINSTTLLCLAGPNIMELSLTGHMLVDGRVFQNALAAMFGLRRLTLDTPYFVFPFDRVDGLVAYKRGSELEFLKLGWAGHTHSVVHVTDFRDVVINCFPEALANAQEVHFDFRHSPAWTNLAFDLLALMGSDTGQGSSTLEIDGETSTYTRYSSNDRVCVMSTPWLRDASATRFHQVIVAPATKVLLTCDGGNLGLLDDNVLAPWERSGVSSNARSLELVLEIPEIIDYTMLAVEFSRSIPMPELRELHLWLSVEDEDVSFGGTELLALGPVCVELLKCFQFPSGVRQFFVGPTGVPDMIRAASDGEFQFTSTDQQPNAEASGSRTEI